MTEKILKSRIVHKHDIAENWAKATGFCPKQGELIIYDDRYTDAEGNEVIVADRVRYKIGNGVNNINDLPFMDDALIETASTQDVAVLAEAQAYTDAAINELNSKVGDTSTLVQAVIDALPKYNGEVEDV